MSDAGYVNYFEILGLDEKAHPGEVRKMFKRKMKSLVQEIARAEITEERRAHYLQEIAKLNAASYILRDRDVREQYWTERQELIVLEEKWCKAAEKDPAGCDELRREFDGKLGAFLSRFVEESMLEAGRDKECLEESHWDAAHERHAFRILRHYRHSLYHEILERLPFYEVTPPKIDWEERARTVAGIMDGGSR